VRPGGRQGAKPPVYLVEDKRVGAQA